MAEPTDPEKDGYTFVDWYTDEATTQAYDFATPVTANLTLYAKWIADSSSDIVFAALTDADKTVIGMREFLLTVTCNNLTQKDSLVFIVGESADAPDWSAVENHRAKITRAFTPEKNSREVFFSVTETAVKDLQSVTVDFPNLPNVANVNDEKAYLKQTVPGLMIAGESYYVHAYNGGNYIKSQQVDLRDYPSATQWPAVESATTPLATSADFPEANSIGPYGWGSPLAWYQRNKNIEVREGELYWLPVRFVYPFDLENPRPNSVCVTKSLEIYYKRSGTTPFTIPPSYFDGTPPNMDNGVFIHASRAIPSNIRLLTVDSYLGINAGNGFSSTESNEFILQIGCFDASTIFNPLKANAFDKTIVFVAE